MKRKYLCLYGFSFSSVRFKRSQTFRNCGVSEICAAYQNFFLSFLGYFCYISFKKEKQIIINRKNIYDFYICICLSAFDCRDIVFDLRNLVLHYINMYH